MNLDGAFRDSESSPDLLVGQATDEKIENFTLALRQVLSLLGIEVSEIPFPLGRDVADDRGNIYMPCQHRPERVTDFPSRQIARHKTMNAGGKRIQRHISVPSRCNDDDSNIGIGKAEAPQPFHAHHSRQLEADGEEPNRVVLLYGRNKTGKIRSFVRLVAKLMLQRSRKTSPVNAMIYRDHYPCVVAGHCPPTWTWMCRTPIYATRDTNRQV